MRARRPRESRPWARCRRPGQRPTRTHSRQATILARPTAAPGERGAGAARVARASPNLQSGISLPARRRARHKAQPGRDIVTAPYSAPPWSSTRPGGTPSPGCRPRFRARLAGGDCGGGFRAARGMLLQGKTGSVQKIQRSGSDLHSVPGFESLSTDVGRQLAMRGPCGGESLWQLRQSLWPLDPLWPRLPQERPVAATATAVRTRTDGVATAICDTLRRRTA